MIAAIMVRIVFWTIMCALIILMIAALIADISNRKKERYTK